MDIAVRLIDVDRQGDTLVLTLRHDLRELEFQEIEAEQEELLRLMASEPSLANVVVDFGATKYFGSTALSLFVRVWREVRQRGGQLALCNVCGPEEDILAVAGFGGTWPVYPSREVAVAAVRR